MTTQFGAKFPLTVASGFAIEQNATYQRQFEWVINSATNEKKDLTGHTAKFAMKDEYSSQNPILVVDSAALSGSRIVLGGVAGTIDLIIVHEDTANLPPNFKGVYDLIIANAGGTVVERFLYGEIQVSPGIAKIG